MSNQPHKTVLVLGARGRFGQAASQTFAARGWRVLAQIRPGAAPADSAGVTWLPLRVDDTVGLCAAAHGASVVVHALNPVYTRWDTDALPLLDAGLQVSARLGATLLLPGNVYNFGSGMPAVLDEHTPQRADTRKGRIRIAMELQLQQAAAAGRVRSVVVRAGDFFGAGSGSWFDQVLLKHIRRGKLLYPGAFDVRTAWAYVPDLAEAFVRVAAVATDRSAALDAFEVLHFQGHTLSGDDWAGPLADAAWDHGWLPRDGQLKTGSLPWPFVKLGGLLVPMWRELAEMSYLWQAPHHLANQKLQGLIGAEPHTELALAVRQSLELLGIAHRSACESTVWA